MPARACLSRAPARHGATNSAAPRSGCPRGDSATECNIETTFEITEMGREGGLAVREGAGGTEPSQATTMPRAVFAIISDFLTWAETGMALFEPLTVSIRGRVPTRPFDRLRGGLPVGGTRVPPNTRSCESQGEWRSHSSGRRVVAASVLVSRRLAHDAGSRMKKCQVNFRETPSKPARGQEV